MIVRKLLMLDAVHKFTVRKRKPLSFVIGIELAGLKRKEVKCSPFQSSGSLSSFKVGETPYYL